MGVRLNWKGEQVTEEVLKNVAAALGEFGLRAEGYSKKELTKGHGVLTGTLRRSIHTAGSAYTWASDNVEPSSGSPERGGQSIAAEISGGKLSLSLGSGLVYALAIHQGWELGYKKTRGSFSGYHFLTNGVNKAKKELPAIIKKYRIRK